MDEEEGAGARERVGELRRRIEQLESADEASFGHFASWDWVACVAGAVVLPLAAVWWFAP